MLSLMLVYSLQRMSNVRIVYCCWLVDDALQNEQLLYKHICEKPAKRLLDACVLLTAANGNGIFFMEPQMLL